MPQTYKNSDFVLKMDDDTKEVMNVIHKYDTYLATLCAGDYSFQQDAVNAVVRFLFSNKYKKTEDLARDNYQLNEKLREKCNYSAPYTAATTAD